jgi:hypothetical protein
MLLITHHCDKRVIKGGKDVPHFESPGSNFSEKSLFPPDRVLHRIVYSLELSHSHFLICC